MKLGLIGAGRIGQLHAELLTYHVPGAAIKTAAEIKCGARFTGAGGGGCIWALGDAGDIEKLKEKWKEVLACREGAGLLNAVIDGVGVSVRE